MANSTNQSNFKCPKCLADVSASRLQAGSRVECPSCNESLTVPESIGGENLFDDLFQEPKRAKQTRDSKRVSDDPRSADLSKKPGVRPESKPVKSKSVAEVDSAAPQPDVSANPSNAADPFGFDESKALKIDGISDRFLETGSFYFSCPICDSKIQASEAQVGEKVKCSDCYSEIKVARNEVKKKQTDAWRQPATLKTGDDDELKLEEPVERPKADYTISPEYGLGSVEDDLLAPVVEAELLENKSPKRNLRPSKKTAGKTRPLERTDRKAAPKDQNMAAKSRSRKPANKPPAALIDSSATVDLQQVAKLDLSGDLDLIIRTVVTIVFLTLFFAMSDSVEKTAAMENLNGGEKFGKYFPALLGAFVCLAVSGWFMAVTFSVLMRTVANGLTRIEEWVGFAPSEWIGSFAIIAFSSWASLLPGVLAGYMAWTVTGWFVFLPMFAAVSVFSLLAIFLTSSFYNESVLKIFSPEIYGSLTRPDAEWGNAFKLFGIALAGFIAGIVIVCIPGLLFCFVGAAVQVLSLTLFAILIGLQARHVITGVV